MSKRKYTRVKAVEGIILSLRAEGTGTVKDGELCVSFFRYPGVDTTILRSEWEDLSKIQNWLMKSGYVRTPMVTDGFNNGWNTGRYIGIQKLFCG